ncbi:hypothetical protein [Thiomicrorhabdus indica]|uniref:hypothetical protein n=1 Tax=Thiomicrorhabdus indica TaxID=2267253 RepID=UPI002AA8F43D|nr:hypothetical protein [Thiomicrorhabdus indica]
MQTALQTTEPKAPYDKGLSNANLAIIKLKRDGLVPIDINIMNGHPVISVEPPAGHHSIRQTAKQMGAIKQTQQLWLADVMQGGQFLAHVTWRDTDNNTGEIQ